jgi:hypothetical protein
MSLLRKRLSLNNCPAPNNCAANKKPAEAGFLLAVFISLADE